MGIGSFPEGKAAWA